MSPAKSSKKSSKQSKSPQKPLQSNNDKQVPLKTSWTINDKDGTSHFLDIYPHELVIGEGVPPNDVGTSFSYERFLVGEWQNNIRVTFGESTLQEVIHAVKLMPNTPEYRRFYDEDNHLLSYFNSIPLDPTLAKFENYENIEEHGSSHYGYLKNFTSQSGILLKTGTELKSETVTLVYGLIDSLDGKPLPMYLAEGFLINNQTNIEKSVGVGLQPEEGIALHDYFYLCDGQSFLMIDKNGNSISQDWEMKLFGSRIRIERVWRISEIVCFYYRWFHQNHPNGVLVFDIQKGVFNKHWTFSEN